MKDQNTVNKDRIVLITNEQRRMIVRALGLLESALNIEEDICSNDYKQSVRELMNIFCEENWIVNHYTNTHKVKPLDQYNNYNMLENLSLSYIIDLICSFCDDQENITAYDRAMYDIHLKDECQQKLNEAIKNTSNDVLIEVIKDGREVPYRNPYCTFSEIFLRYSSLKILQYKN